MLNKGEVVQSFCGRMPFLSPTSMNHSLDLIFSVTTNSRTGNPLLSPVQEFVVREKMSSNE